MADVLDRLVTKDERTVLDVENVEYIVTPLALLDENIRTCIATHRDALLDVRLHLYPESIGSHQHIDGTTVFGADG